MSGYEMALEMAGARVIAFDTFGSWQGDWLAQVEYKGKIGWIHDYYGSCSGCDAFMGELGYEDEHSHSGDYVSYYDLIDTYDASCNRCKRMKEKVVKLAQNYLDDIRGYEEVLKEVSEDIDWDMDARKMVDFMKTHKEGI